MFAGSDRLDVSPSPLRAQGCSFDEPKNEVKRADTSVADILLRDDSDSSCRLVEQECPEQAMSEEMRLPVMQLEDQVKQSLDQLSAYSPRAALQGIRQLSDRMWGQRNFRIDIVLADGFVEVASRLPADFVVDDSASLQRLDPRDVRSLRLYAFCAAWHLRERAQANLARQLKPELDAHGVASIAPYRPLVRGLIQASHEARLHIALWTNDIVAAQHGNTPLAEPDAKLTLILSGNAYNLKVEAAGGSPGAVWTQWEEDVHAQMFRLKTNRTPQPPQRADKMPVE